VDRTGGIVSIPSPSGLLQNANLSSSSFFFSFQSLLLQVSFKTTYRAYNLAASEFQSLLLQVSFKTDPEETLAEIRVSIPSPSGLLQNIEQEESGGTL